MNQALINKLKLNPHYKIGKRQLIDEEEDRKPMIEFGVPNSHDNHFNMHDVKTVVVKRKKRV